MMFAYYKNVGHIEYPLVLAALLKQPILKSFSTLILDDSALHTLRPRPTINANELC